MQPVLEIRECKFHHPKSIGMEIISINRIVGVSSSTRESLANLEQWKQSTSYFAT